MFPGLTGKISIFRMPNEAQIKKNKNINKKALGTEGMCVSGLVDCMASICPQVGAAQSDGRCRVPRWATSAPMGLNTH